MTTQNPKPASRHPVKREREADEDSHDSSFADLAETTPKRGHKATHGRSHHRDSNPKVFQNSPNLLDCMLTQPFIDDEAKD